MRKRLITHYLPVLFVLLIGTTISWLAQNQITRNEQQQLNKNFDTFTSILTLQLQGLIDRHASLITTLGNAISLMGDIHQTKEFKPLITRFMADEPGIAAVYILSAKQPDQQPQLTLAPNQNPAQVIARHHVHYEQKAATPLPHSGTGAAIISRRLNGNDTASPYYLVALVNTGEALANLFNEVVPDWLSLVIYQAGADSKPQVAYHYSTPAAGPIELPTAPTHTGNPFATYLPNTIVSANQQPLSVLFLPTEHGYFEVPALKRWLPLSSGMLISLLLAVYLLSILRRNDTVNQLVASRTKELANTAESLRQEFEKRQELVTRVSRSEEQLRAVMNAVDGMFWECDLINRRFTFVSDHITPLMGFTQEDAYRDVNLFRGQMLSDYRRRFDAAIKKMSEDDGTKQIEVQTLRADGKVIWIRSTLSMVFAQGRPVKMRGLTVDVTKYKKLGQDRAQLMESISQSQKELSSLVNSIDGVLWKYNIDPPQYTYVSKQLELFLGCPAKEALKNPDFIKERIVPEDIDRVTEQMDAIRRNAKADGKLEFRLRRNDGSLLYVRNLVTPIVEKGVITQLHGVLLDITREKKLQEERELLETQLKQAQKLEAIGQLAAGIAHEINTPTQFVGDNICYLQESFEDIKKILEMYADLLHSLANDPTYSEQCAKIQALQEEIDLEFLFADIPSSINQSLEGTTRIRDIVKAMKEFSHPGVSTKEAIDLNRAIKSTIIVTRNEWKYVAEVATELAEDLPPVNVLPGEFNQVILNILVNAAQAIDERCKRPAGQNYHPYRP